MIRSFTGKHRFLLLVYRANLTFRGVTYPSAAHAYQAAKTDDPVAKAAIAVAESPMEARELGHQVIRHAQWTATSKIATMRAVQSAKFLNPKLLEMLLETGTQTIIAGNDWGDTFWGVHKDKGSNHLGSILMEIRDIYRTFPPVLVRPR